jgi:hypothetical protein
MGDTPMFGSVRERRGLLVGTAAGGLVIVSPDGWWAMGASGAVVMISVSLLTTVVREVFWWRAQDRPATLLRLVRRTSGSPEEHRRLLRLLLDAQAHVADARVRADDATRTRQPHSPAATAPRPSSRSRRT